MTITIRYESIDSYGRGKSRTFKTLKGAQKFAHDMVGAHPELGCTYAVSDDGIVTITCHGCTLPELFPEEKGPGSVDLANLEAAAEAEGERYLETGRCSMIPYFNISSLPAPGDDECPF